MTSFPGIRLQIHARYAHPNEGRWARFKQWLKGTTEINFGWYQDWWIRWIERAPVPVEYVEDEELLYSHPCEFCRLVCGSQSYLVGFDLWDKYPVFAHHPNDTENVRARWDRCAVCFKTNYFDASAPTRYRGPIGYVPREEDQNRALADEAAQTNHIYPCGMPLARGWPFQRGRYKKLRKAERSIDANAFGSKKSAAVVRVAMRDAVGERFPIHFQPYDEYLTSLGDTKICIDFPSNSRVTFRTSESMALGAMLIGPSVANLYPNDFSLANCFVLCKPDGSDLNDRIDEYLGRDAERRERAAYAASEWDRKLAPEPLARWWVETMVAHLNL